MKKIEIDVDVSVLSDVQDVEIDICDSVLFNNANGIPSSKDIKLKLMLECFFWEDETDTDDKIVKHRKSCKGCKLSCPMKNKYKGKKVELK